MSDLSDFEWSRWHFQYDLWTLRKQCLYAYWISLHSPLQSAWTTWSFFSAHNRRSWSLPMTKMIHFLTQFFSFYKKFQFAWKGIALLSLETVLSIMKCIFILPVSTFIQNEAVEVFAWILSIAFLIHKFLKMLKF